MSLGCEICCSKWDYDALPPFLTLRSPTHAQSASIMRFAPSRFLMDNLG